MESMKKDDNDSMESCASLKMNLDESGGTKFLGGMFNVSNAALGAGLLTFPRSFATTGTPLGVILQVIITVLVFVGLVLIGRVTHLTASQSYPMLLQRLLGKKVEKFAICLLIFFTWTVCIAYLQVIVSQLTVFGRLVEGISKCESSSWYLEGRFLMTISSSFVVLPAALLPTMALVSRVSGVAIAACWYIVLFVVISAVTYPKTCKDVVAQAAQDSLDNTPYTWRLLGTLPAMAFGYQCHLSSVNNFSSLKKTAKASYAYIALLGALICFVTYSAVGVAGYSLFRVCAGTKALILDNYADDDIFANVGRGFVTLAVAFSYPVFSFTGRHELLRLFDTLCMSHSWEISERNIFMSTLDRRRFWLTLFWFGSTVGIACIEGDMLSYVINFIGIFCLFWMLIFPGLFAIKLADLTHEETIDAALAKLPGAPCEEVGESWANGIRNRVTRWLSPRERLMLRVVGILFVSAGVSLACVGFATFFYGVIEARPRDNECSSST